MEVVFENASLALIETANAGETGLSVGIIKSTRRKLTVLRAAVDERSLKSWKSLHYEELKTEGVCRRSIQLNDQFRLIFLLEENAQLPRATILSIEDHH